MQPEHFSDATRVRADQASRSARLIALAERDPRRAVRLARALCAAAPDAPLARLALGWALLRWERIAEARAELETVSAERLAAGDEDAVRLCRYGLLCARQLAGEGDELQAAWAALAELHEAAGEMAEALRARCEQIAHLNLLGRYPQARALAAASTDAVRRYALAPEQARYCHVAGVAAAGCGDFAAAGPLLDEAIDRLVALRRPIAVARVRFERAWVAERRELFELARRELEAARAVFHRFELPARAALCDRDLGFLAARLGDYGTAIALTVRAREVFVELQRPAMAAGFDMNLGAFAHYSGLLDLAEAAYERSHAAYVAAGLRRRALVCRRNQAALLLERGNAAQSLALLDRIAPEIAELEDHLEAAEAAVIRARALASDDRQAAHASLAEARSRFAALDNQAAVAECQLEQGWLHLQEGAYALAADSFAAALAPLQDRPAHLWRVQYGLGRIAEAAADDARAIVHYSEAGDLVARLRRSLVSEHASSALFAQARPLYADAINLAVRRNDPVLLLSFVEQQRALTLQRQLLTARPGATAELEARRARLRASLDDAQGPSEREAALRDYLASLLQARHQAPLAALPHQAPFSLEQLRASLGSAYGDEWTLLAPISFADELLLVTVTPETAQLDREPLAGDTALLLERACLPRYRMHTYRDLATLRAGGAPAWAVLSELGRRLVPPAVRARLDPEHRLLIVPDGVLHALPWSALRVDDAWLIERAVVELLPALAPLRLVAAAPPPAAAALLIGCAEFGERAVPLPRALETLALVEACWPGPTVRIAESQASRAAVLDLAATGALGEYRLVHIAAHAHLGSEGLLAHIKLYDDDLLADEILGLGLGGAMVVLAACSGAAGEVLPGAEVLGLGRMLLAAGARSVVAGQWQIYDGGVMRLLEPFYRALAGGADAALALARAQRAMLHEQDGEPSQTAILRSPLVWASMCVTSVGLAHRL
jgi:hypothetical protein